MDREDKGSENDESFTNIFGKKNILDQINYWMINQSKPKDIQLSKNEEKMFENMEIINLPNQRIVRLDRFCADVISDYIPLSVQRPLQEPIYTYSGFTPSNVGYNGEHLPDIMYSNTKIETQTNKWLNKLGYNFKLKIKKFPGSDLFEIRFEDISRKKGVKKIDFSFKDIGTGMASILPIIVNCTQKNKTLSFQEPERSLHPFYQLKMMDMFCETINENNNNLIIETHSDLLVLRLMKLIKKGVINYQDVSVNYIVKNNEGSHIYNLKIDQEGNFIDKWPEGFFNERIKVSIE